MNDKFKTEFYNLMKQSKENWYKDIKKSFEFTEEAFKLAQKKNNQLFLAIIYNEFGVLYMISNKFVKALSYNKKALSIFKKLKLDKEVLSVINNIGNIYFYTGKYKLATKYYEKSLQLKLRFNNKESLAKAYNNLASVYTKQGFYKLALENFLKALKIRENLGNSENKANTLMNIGGLYMQLRDYPNAKEYLNQAYNLYLKESNKINIANILSNISMIYRNEGNYSESEKLLKKAMNINEKISYEINKPNNFLSLGKTYFLWGKSQKAKVSFKKSLKLAKDAKDYTAMCYSKLYLSKLSNNPKETKKLLYSALDIALKQNNRDELLIIYQDLYEFYEKEKDFEKAYNYLKNYTIIKENIDTDEQDHYLMELQKKYDIEKRIKEIKILKKENRLLKEKIKITYKLNKAKETIKKQENKIELISKELSGKIERNFIGNSKAIKDVLKLAMTCASYKDVSVLITGENGTGKEIIARIIHYSSERKKYPFFPVNCSAVPESLLESEFFGYAKGAFTGAQKDKKGIFQLANHGTLFLDEIADMPYLLQSKLLRVLEEKKVNRLGDSKNMSVELRIISATNKDILKLIDLNQFRIDLFHRINTINIHIPPLRERPEDIEPLLIHYVEYFSKIFNKPIPKIDKSLIKHLQDYNFPGNVRELRNLVERAIILSNDDILISEDFPITKRAKKEDKSIKINSNTSEVILIKKAMQENDFNQSKAAKQLGISRDALIRKMKKYHLHIKKEIVQ